MDQQSSKPKLFEEIRTGFSTYLLIDTDGNIVKLLIGLQILKILGYYII